MRLPAEVRRGLRRCPGRVDGSRNAPRAHDGGPGPAPITPVGRRVVGLACRCSRPPRRPRATVLASWMGVRDDIVDLRVRIARAGGGQGVLRSRSLHGAGAAGCSRRRSGGSPARRCRPRGHDGGNGDRAGPGALASLPAGRAPDRGGRVRRGVGGPAKPAPRSRVAWPWRLSPRCRSWCSTARML
jgi:hypothetical protein